MDSGTTAAYLPSDIIEAIGESIGAEYNSNVQSYVMYCTMDGGLIWNFSGVELFTPFSQLLLPATTQDGSPAKINGKDVCSLPFFPSDSSTGSGLLLLGDIVMRSLYVVYDYDTYEVSLANTNFNVKDSNVEAISSGVPSATKAPGYSSTKFSQDIETNVAKKLTSTVSAPTFTNQVGYSGAEDVLTATQSIDAGAAGETGASGSNSSSQSSSSSSKGKNQANLLEAGGMLAVPAAVAAMLL